MKKSKFSEDDTVSISSKRSKIDNDQVIKEEVTTSTTISTSTTCTTLAPIVCDPSNDHTSNIDVSSPSHALGPPTLYCDGAHVIRRVLEVDGKFIALKKVLKNHVCDYIWLVYDVLFYHVDMISFYH